MQAGFANWTLWGRLRAGFANWTLWGRSLRRFRLADLRPQVDDHVLHGPAISLFLFDLLPEFLRFKLRLFQLLLKLLDTRLGLADVAAQLVQLRPVLFELLHLGLQLSGGVRFLAPVPQSRRLLTRFKQFLL